MIEAKNIWINRERGRGGGRGVKNYCDLYSGRKFLGATPDIFTYSVRFSHVARYGVEVSDQNNNE